MSSLASAFGIKKARAISSSALLVCSLLFASTASATFDKNNAFNNNDNTLDRNNKNVKSFNNPEALLDAGFFTETPLSPFTVTDSKGLNNALAILENDCNNFGFKEEKDGRKNRRREDRFEEDEEWFLEGSNKKDVKKSNINSKKTNNKVSNDNNNRNNKKHKHGQGVFGSIFIDAPGPYQLDREFIFGDQCFVEIVGAPGVVINSAPNKRHFSFEDKAFLRASEISLENGGNDRKGFHGGSILFLNKAGARFQTVDFRNNRAWVGGAVFIQGSGRVRFNDGIFENNQARRRGGAVAIQEEAKKDGKGVEEDGIFWWSGGEENFKSKHKRNRVTFDYVTFTRNDAGNEGGAIWNQGHATEVNFSHFFENHSRIGGAIFNGGNMLIRESVFDSNHADERGGAIANFGRLLIICSTFINNTPDDIFNEGVLRCSATTTPVNITGNGQGICVSCAPTPAPTRRPTRSPTSSPSPSPTYAPPPPTSSPTGTPSPTRTVHPTRSPSPAPTPERKFKKVKKHHQKKKQQNKNRRNKKGEKNVYYGREEENDYNGREDEDYYFGGENSYFNEKEKKFNGGW